LRKAKGHYWYPINGPRILDACGGAGVACLGHGRRDIIKAVATQMNSYTYASYAHFRTSPVEDLSNWLIKSTGGKMQKVYVMCSGKSALRFLTPPGVSDRLTTTSQAPKQWKPP
jgi:adenosylmethionine-8-amino-7-oxononanoate aminotransferase